jgi:hypothetical protein
MSFINMQTFLGGDSADSDSSTSGEKYTKSTGRDYTYAFIEPRTAKKIALGDSGNVIDTKNAVFEYNNHNKGTVVLDVELQKQKKLPWKEGSNDPKEKIAPSATGCYFASLGMALSYFNGKTIDINDLYRKSNNINKSNASVGSEQGLINDAYKLTGNAVFTKGKLFFYEEPARSLKEIGQSIINQINTGRPVILNYKGPHKELVFGYHFDTKYNKLVFLVHDPGYQDDIFLDAYSLEPFKIDQIEKRKQYSHVSHSDNRRPVQSICYFMKLT